MDENLLNATQVASKLGVCVQTIDRWYKWKNLHSDEDIAKLLPDYTRVGCGRGGGRRWRESDIPLFENFQSHLTTGRCGIMGDVTQMYVKKKT